MKLKDLDKANFIKKFLSMWVKAEVDLSIPSTVAKHTRNYQTGNPEWSKYHKLTAIAYAESIYDDFKELDEDEFDKRWGISRFEAGKSNHPKWTIDTVRAGLSKSGKTSNFLEMNAEDHQKWNRIYAGMEKENKIKQQMRTEIEQDPEIINDPTALGSRIKKSMGL